MINARRGEAAGGGDPSGGQATGGEVCTSTRPQFTTEPTQAQIENARRFIQHLLGGGKPDGTSPDDCGDYADTVAALQEAYTVGGTEAVRSAFLALAQSDQGLIAFVSSESEQTKALLQAGADDEGNAQSVTHLHAGEFLHCEAYGWLRWVDTHWESGGAEALVDRAIVNTLQQRCITAVQTNPPRNEVLTAAKPTAHHVRAAKYLLQSLVTANVSEFDASPDHLNCANGVLDLRTGELTPHTPGQRFTYCLPVEYDPTADAAEWLRFLSAAVSNASELMSYLQQAVGYSLTGHTSEECLFYVHGPTRSGKGTFTETLLAMLGHEPMATEVDFTTFTAKRDGDTQNFDLAPLKPARFIAASESAKYQPLNTAKLKQLTGGNEIRCAFKYRTHFAYRPQFKIWLSSNRNVNADVEDDAAWYRVKVIHFPHSWAGREDKRLKARLRKPENLQGVLAWAVQGAMMWYASGAEGLVTPEPVTRATEDARTALDFVGHWLEECTEQREEDFVPNPQLYDSYKAWCEENGVTEKGMRSLTQDLKAKGYQAGERRWHHGKAQRGCVGIRLT